MAREAVEPHETPKRDLASVTPHTHAHTQRIITNVLKIGLKIRTLAEEDGETISGKFGGTFDADHQWRTPPGCGVSGVVAGR